MSSLRGDIAVSASSVALLVSIGAYFTACAALVLSIAFLNGEEG